MTKMESVTTNTRILYNLGTFLDAERDLTCYCYSLRFGNFGPLWYHSAMIWTISDLHLSFATPKPMDIFGDRWRDHPQRIAAAWNERVRAEDTVLIAGDSWALKLADARPYFDGLLYCLGEKLSRVAIHHHWWVSSGRVRCAAAVVPSR